MSGICPYKICYNLNFRNIHLPKFTPKSIQKKLHQKRHVNLFNCFVLMITPEIISIVNANKRKENAKMHISEDF